MADVSQAIQLALELARAPRLVHPMRRRPLPHGVLNVIRIAGGCDETCSAAARTTDESPERIRSAASFYLQQVLLFPGSDSYRTLGAMPDDPQETLHEHMRWMMRWLHPDRTRDEWASAFSQRVLHAWDDVKSPDRRARYDRKKPAGRMAGATSTAGSRRKRGKSRYRSASLSWIAQPVIRARSWTSGIVAGSIAGLVLLLGLALWLVRAA